MTIFKLPDLGEGLPDAEIQQWYVKVGDKVTVDQPLVSMETAKAVVDVPSPETGVIKKLFGKPGDIIITHAPLVEFESESNANTRVTDEATPRKDTGTVVGSIESRDETISEATSVGGKDSSRTHSDIKATPAVRALARKLNVDLSNVTATGPNNTITASDVEKYQTVLQEVGELTLLRGARRVMAHNMTKSNQEVVPVSIFDDADIHHWGENTDITINIIKALIVACKEEPALNAWFDGNAVGVRQHQSVNLGIAMDTGDELFVPVLHKADTLDDKALREQINTFKANVKNRAVPKEQLTGASITLSNFGTFAGRYASPIIVPPQVAIIAIGKIREAVVAYEGNAVVHKILPISVSFDHRAVTGGEATRFLGAMIKALENG